ncbi:hypothetical protein ACTWQL_13750 [Pseudalkalibacillus sp. R45]|uniref:hypothetical protein n=1 Tax=Pseudalkalibacillus sp. R45 TaxID=3457433 RepID=UPI003FCCF5AE
MKKNRLETMIDPKTGEFVYNAVRLEPGDRLTTAKEMERNQLYIDSRFKKRFHHGRNYVVSYVDQVREVAGALSMSEAGALIKLLLQLRIKSDGVVMYEGKPARKGDIAKIIGVTRPTANNYIDKFTEVGVLSVVEKKFVINRNFHAMGGQLEKRDFTKLYTVKTREIIDRLSLEDVGMLYHFLPYFHYMRYYLCEIPTCDPTEIDFIGTTRLSEITDIHRTLVNGRMKKLQSAGAVLITGTRNQTRYLIHPDLMFRQPEGTETEWTRSVRQMFEDHGKEYCN